MQYCRFLMSNFNYLPSQCIPSRPSVVLYVEHQQERVTSPRLTRIKRVFPTHCHVYLRVVDLYEWIQNHRTQNTP